MDTPDIPDGNWIGNKWTILWSSAINCGEIMKDFLLDLWIDIGNMLMRLEFLFKVSGNNLYHLGYKSNLFLTRIKLT